MNYQIHVPAGPLADFVEYFWSLRDAPADAKGSVLPSGTLGLVIHLDEDEARVYDSESAEGYRPLSGAVVSGVYDRAFTTHAREHASAVGVHFRPGGSWPFFGLPLGELAGAHVDLRMLWGDATSELRERLWTAEAHPDRIRILEAALGRRLNHAPAGHRAVAIAVRELELGETSVGAVAERVGLSRRRLIELFTAQVGVTPKKFSRLRRFQRVLQTTRHVDEPIWSDVALGCGYFDQSHLIRDFVDFSGLSPAEYARVRSADATNHHVRLSG